MRNKFAKLIRILTTAPVFAAILCSLLYALLPDSFASAERYFAALGFLTALPLLAYPASYAIPSLRKKGRDGQRNLAVGFSIIGYIGGFLLAVLGGGTATEKVMFGTYLISGVGIAVCTLLHFKASGHTCGCSGPIAMLALYANPWFLIGYLLLTPIFWASKQLGRHSAAQLFAGAAIPVLAMLLCRLIFLPH
ncbi:MAG: hypothetical protein IJJ99_03210 [Oscillospiraceae bacterium]|nr:hypothetical protein [Oscillospiraceae bacterium]